MAISFTSGQQLFKIPL